MNTPSFRSELTRGEDGEKAADPSAYGKGRLSSCNGYR
jgi:hypothetical protein